MKKEENEQLKYKRLEDDEIGCYTCSRSRTGSRLCKSCIRWSNWQGVEQLNEKLRCLRLPTYIDATEMRIDTLLGTKEALKYRIRFYRKKRTEIGKGA